MRPLLCLALPLAIAAGAAACVKPEAPRTAAEMHARLTQELQSVTSYRAKITSEIHAEAMLQRMRPDAGPIDVEAMRGTIDIEVVRPDRMRMSATTRMSAETSMRIESVFDGGTVWFAVTMGEQTQNVVLDQKKLAAPGKPFDVGYNARGFGLMEGEDLVGTLQAFLRNWRFTELAPTTFEGKDALVLRGALDVDAAIDDLLGKEGERGGQLLAGTLEGVTDRALSDQIVAELVRSFAGSIKSVKACELFVAPNGAVLGWTLGGDAGVLQRAVVTSFDKNPALDAARFTIDPQQRAAATDITAQVLGTRQARPVDPKQLAELRERLRAAAR